MIVEKIKFWRFRLRNYCSMTVPFEPSRKHTLRSCLEITIWMSSPFVKKLVASDRKSRDAAVASLTNFLSSSRQFDDIELLKLWKALFYCFWHSDRVLVQQNLAKELSNLCLKVKDNNFIPFIRAFWVTICREWNGIDILRLDKFYTLTRLFIAAAFEKLVSIKWSEQLLEQYVSLMEEIPLSPTNVKTPNGVRYHIADIWIEELHKAVREQEKRKDVPIEVLMRPFEMIITKSPTKSVRLRVLKSVFELSSLLDDYGYSMAKADSDEEMLMDGTVVEEMSEQEDSSTNSEDDAQDEDEEFTGFT